MAVIFQRCVRPSIIGVYLLQFQSVILTKIVLIKGDVNYNYKPVNSRLVNFFNKNKLVVQNESVSRCRQTESVRSSDGTERIVEEVKSCSMESAAIFTENISFAPLLLRSLSSAALQITSYDVTGSQESQLYAFLRESYIDLGIRSFLIASHRPYAILSLAEKVSHDFRIGKTALMPHNTKWLVIFMDDFQREAFLENQRHSSFDNVAVWVFRDKGLLLLEVHTLRWGSNRSRYADTVSLQSVGRSCLTFPNTKHNFNGRHLHVLTKLYAFDAYIQVKQTENKDKPELSGMYVDVFNLLAKSLNFSYTVTITNVSWDKFVEELYFFEWDMSLVFWTSTGTITNLDITYPIYIDHAVGFYFEPLTGERNYWIMENNVISPFPRVMYVFLLASLVFSIFLYTTIKNLKLGRPGNPRSTTDVSSLVVFDTISATAVDQIPEQERHFHPGRSNYKVQGDQIEADALSGDEMNPYDDSSPKGKNSSRFRFRPSVHDLFSTFWTFMPSMLNQGYLPNPDGLAARGYVCTWAFFTLCFSAVFTGYITSHRVALADKSRIESFEELLNCGQYQWLFLKNSVIADIFHNSTSPLFQKLETGAMILNDESIREKFLAELRSKLESRKVFLYYNFMASEIAVLTGEAFCLRIVTEELVQIQFGFGLPKDSQLNEALSGQIKWLHDTGNVHKILSKYCDPDDTKCHPRSQGFDKRKRAVQLEDLIIVLILVLCFLGLSLGLLAIEILVWYIRTFRQT